MPAYDGLTLEEIGVLVDALHLLTHEIENGSEPWVGHVGEASADEVTYLAALSRLHVLAAEALAAR